MKISTILFISFLSFGSAGIAQTDVSKALKNFNTFLGSEKATALDEGLASFHDFLNRNFPEEKTQSERMRTFLKYIANNNELDSTWVVDSSEREKLINDWEVSGMRKEVWLYGYENSDNADYALSKLIKPEDPDTSEITNLDKLDIDLIYDDEPEKEIDTIAVAKMEREWEDRRRNSLHTNLNGRFWYGIAKYANDNLFVSEYIEMIYRENFISPAVVASGLTNEDWPVAIDFDNPFIQRIVLVEFYFPSLIYQQWGRKN